jgi:hypothetical protein
MIFKQKLFELSAENEASHNGFLRWTAERQTFDFIPIVNPTASGHLVMATCDRTVCSGSTLKHGNRPRFRLKTTMNNIPLGFAARLDANECTKEQRVVRNGAAFRNQRGDYAPSSDAAHAQWTRAATGHELQLDIQGSRRQRMQWTPRDTPPHRPHFLPHDTPGHGVLTEDDVGEQDSAAISRPIE